MQTANDAPDRDVKVVLIEGTNDSVSGWDDGASWSEITQIDDIPAIGDRFTTQEFYFQNDKGYTSYRWTVLDTQGPSSCCMQIAEVEFLAATTTVDCDLAAFKRQPVDVVVLDGEPATFLVEVNGPWPLQWHKNGEPISGAVSTSYTTEAVNAGNASDKYSVQIVGCEMSSEVVATIHDPSAHPVSIGLNFNGSGANGAPTASLPTDVAGVQLQAYWNNVASASGTNDEVLLDSLGEEALGVDDYEITLDFASAGNWGAGTGDANPTQRLLNGTLVARGGDAHIEFQEVPDGNHTLIAYTVGIPLQFQNQYYKLVGEDEDSDRVIYTEAMNADQYNPIQRYFRGTSTDPANRTLSNYVRFDNVKPVEGYVRFEWGTSTVGFDRGVAINAIQLILDNPALEIDAPSITANPTPTVAQEGSAASMTVVATGEGLTYQWLKNGAAIPDGGKIAGATTDTLVVNGLSEAEEGFYSLAIFNDAGSVISSRAKLSMVSSGATMSDDLVVHLKFDETSGTTASNSGSGTDTATIYDDYGEPNEEPVGADGLIGNAILINGADSETYAFGVLDNYPKIKDNGTVSLWLNTPGIDGESAVVVRNGSAINIVTENQFQITITNNIDGEPVLGCQISAGPNVINVVDTEALAFDEWVHVALTVDGGQLRFYKNGKLIGVTDYLDRINGSTEDWLAIGANLTLVQEEGEDPYFAMDEANPQAFSGSIDDLALWHVARGADEIQAIYNKGLGGEDASKAAVTIPDFVEPGEIIDPEAAPEILIDFAGTGPNSAGASPDPWVTINNLVMDEAVDLGGGVTITALDDGFNPNNPAQPGEGAEYDGVSVPQEARNDYLFKIADAAGTTARMRIDGLAAGTYNVTVFEGRTTDASQFAKIWTGEEPATENTGDFAKGSATVTVTVGAGESLWYMHLEDGSGGVSGMMIREAADTPALSIVNNGDGTATVTFEGKLQGASTVNGPWADVEGAVSPQIIPATEAMQYGRAVSE